MNVNRGNWIYMYTNNEGISIYMCNNCGYHSKLYAYCPHCGKQMLKICEECSRRYTCKSPQKECPNYNIQKGVNNDTL